jgi:hypothetical protein
VPAARIRIRSVRRALLVALLALGPAAAQSTLDTIREDQAPNTTLCMPRSTRAAAHCDPKQTVVRTEKQQTISLELPAPSTKYCAAAIEFEYTQRDTFVRVVSTINNADCAASSGEVEISVRVRDANLDVKKLDFTEPWQRSDDKPVSLSRDYPIGTNVDVLSVRGRSVRCGCAG